MLFFLPWFSNHLETILKKYLCHNGFSFKKYTLQLSWIPIAHISLLSGVRILSQTEIAHSRIKTPHFRSRATYFFLFFLVTIKCGTRQRQPVIKEFLDWNNIKYVLFTHDWDVLRSSFAQRISSKGQSYFHNPLFTLWISVDVIGSCSLLNQNLALFCYEYSILIKTNLFIQML